MLFFWRATFARVTSRKRDLCALQPRAAFARPVRQSQSTSLQSLTKHFLWTLLCAAGRS